MSKEKKTFLGWLKGLFSSPKKEVGSTIHMKDHVMSVNHLPEDEHINKLSNASEERERGITITNVDNSCQHEWKKLFSNSEVSSVAIYSCTKCKAQKTENI